MSTSTRPRPAWQRAAAALAVVVVLVVGTAGPASAHASLVSVDPPDGARLDESPPTVTLTFSEAISVDLGGVRVLDADGTSVHVGAARVEGAVATVDLRPDLPPGTYIVAYRVVGEDGHPVRGGSVFAVGDVEVDSTALGRVSETGTETLWDLVGVLGRSLSYLGTFLAAGGALFLVVVHREPAPGSPEDLPGGERRRLVRIVRGAAVLGVLASAVALPVQAALGTGRGPGSLLDEGVLREVAGEGLGHSVLLNLVGLGLVALGAGRSRAATTVGALVAAGSFAATGHTRAGEHVLVATLADVAHLMAAAAWGGGLLALWLLFRARRRAGTADTEDTAEHLVRFSQLATVATLSLAAGGSVLAWSQVRSPGGLTGTGYGMILLAKVGVLAVVLSLAAYNHYRLVPAMRSDRSPATISRFRDALGSEAVGLLAILVLSSVLVVVTPATAAVSDGPVEVLVDLGDTGSVQVVVDPAKAGFNEIHLYTYDPDGRPADIAESVRLELSLPSAELGPLYRDATRAGPAHFQLTGSDLATSGTWYVIVRLLVDRFSEVAGTFDLVVGS